MELNGTLVDCFTCRRKTDNFLSICDEASTEPVEQALSHHFWFSRTDFEQSVLCTSCWEKIDEFHKFYCEVANLHQNNPFEHVQIKEEELNIEADNIPVAEEQENLTLQSEGVDRQVEDPLPKEVKIELAEQELPDELHSEEIKIHKKVKKSSKPTADKRTRRLASLARDDYIRKNFKNMICPDCSKAFKTFKQFAKHCGTLHGSPAVVICCDRQYRSQVAIYDHLLSHAKNVDRFACKKCNRCFKNSEGLKMHTLLHHTSEEDKKFRCDRCDQAFATKTFLASHLNWHATVEPMHIICLTCNKYFKTIKNLNDHTKTHHPEPLVPPVSPTNAENGEQPPNPSPTVSGLQSRTVDAPAEAEFDKDSASTTQGRNKAAGRRKAEVLIIENDLIRKYCALNCEKCDFSTDTYNKLILHYKHEHDCRGYATCCSRKFSKRSRLYDHARVHENPDQFKCQDCDKRFQNNDALANHVMWMHTPDWEKPFCCDVCGQRFGKDYLLKHHMDYHVALEEKKFACEHCGRCFGRKPQLRVHEQTTHGLGTDWLCDVCAKGFPLQSLLELHRKQQHPQEVGIMRCTSDALSCEGNDKEEEPSTKQVKRNAKPEHMKKTQRSCSFCGKIFTRLGRLKEHEAGHTGDMLFMCEYCPRRSNSSAVIYGHRKVAHPEEWAQRMANRNASK